MINHIQLIITVIIVTTHKYLRLKPYPDPSRIRNLELQLVKIHIILLEFYSSFLCVGIHSILLFLGTYVTLVLSTMLDLSNRDRICYVLFGSDLFLFFLDRYLLCHSIKLSLNLSFCGSSTEPCISMSPFCY